MLQTSDLKLGAHCSNKAGSKATKRVVCVETLGDSDGEVVGLATVSAREKPK